MLSYIISHVYKAGYAQTFNKGINKCIQLSFVVEKNFAYVG